MLVYGVEEVFKNPNTHQMVSFGNERFDIFRALPVMFFFFMTLVIQDHCVHTTVIWNSSLENAWYVSTKIHRSSYYPLT